MASGTRNNLNYGDLIKFVVLTVICVHQASSYERVYTNDLRQILFESYDPRDMPSTSVAVTASLNLLSLKSLDIREQKLSIAAYFFFRWHDPRLNWLNTTELAEFAHVISVFSMESQIWTPPIIIENSVDDIDVISRPNVPIRVNGIGYVDWVPAGIFTTHCESTVTYWPLDTQTCDMVISTWGVTSQEVTLSFSSDVMLATEYQVHGEWDLVSMSSRVMETKREGMPFRRLIFTVTLRRRHLFHTLNTLIPVILFGLLTIVVFKLNPESGERVGLSLTILLAYSVYLGLISESIPQTSLSASLLSMYLATILLLQTCSVLLTVIYLDVYFTPDEKPIPKWLQSMTKIFLAKLVDERKKAKVWPLRNLDEKNMVTMTVEDMDDEHKEKLPDDAGENTPNYQYTWKEIARVLDKITMYVYMVVLFSLTLIIGGIMIYHYCDTSYYFQNE